MVRFILKLGTSLQRGTRKGANISHKTKEGSCWEVAACLSLLQTTGSQLFTVNIPGHICYLHISKTVS